MVGKCWCKAPHKHNRVSPDLHPLLQRHIMKTNDRQSSRPLTHGPRNNNHNRTCRRTWITLRCADTADTYDPTHVSSAKSVPLSPRRSGVVTYPHGPKKSNMQHDNKNTKHANTLENTRNKPQTATTAPKRTASVSTARFYVLEHILTHRAMWTHGGQMSAHNGPRITTRIYNTTCTTRKRPHRE